MFPLPPPLTVVWEGGGNKRALIYPGGGALLAQPNQAPSVGGPLLMMNTSPTSPCGEDLNYAFLNTKQPSFFFCTGFCLPLANTPFTNPPPYPKGLASLALALACAWAARGISERSGGLAGGCSLIFLLKKLKKI